MSQSTVTIYLTNWCPYCRRAKGLLADKNIPWEEINIDADPALRQEMVARSNRKTVPQIFIGDQHVGGCDELFALEATGELDRLLQAMPRSTEVTP